MTEQEVSELIVSWAEENFDPISTADDEMADMVRIGLLSPGVRVDLISLEPLPDTWWKARLSIAGGRFDIVVTFWIDSREPLEEDQLQIEDIQEEAGTKVPPLEKRDLS